MYLLLPESPDSTVLKPFTSVEQLFDPRQNKFYFTRESFNSRTGSVTLANYVKARAALFTRHNLTNNPQMFFRHWIPGITTVSLETILSAIPDEDLFALNFVNFDGLDGQKWHSTFYVPVGNGNHPQIYSYDCRYDTCNSRMGVTSDGFPASFAEKVSTLATTIRTNEADHMSKGFITHNTVGVAASPNRLLMYMMGMTIISQDGVGSFATEDTLLALSAEGTALSIAPANAFERGRDITIKIVAHATRSNRSMLHRVFNYTANPCDYFAWPILEKGEHKPVLYGVELEVSTDYRIQDLINAPEEPFFIGKSDASISGSKSGAIELVTAPMSYKAQRRHWASFFNKLDYTRFDVTTQTTNGMHVHIGRDHFDDEKHLRSLTWFILNPSNRDFIVFMSERGSYSAMERYTPIAAIPNNTTRVQAFKRCISIAAPHRGAINLGKPATVEIRIFRGIVSLAELYKNLEFVDSLFHFTRENPLLSDLCVSRYLKWLENTPHNKYAILKKFIGQHDSMDTIVAASEVYDVIFNTTDPDSIVERLKKSNLIVNNLHIAILNRGRKRTFMLDKDTGEVGIRYLNRSKLFHLDRDLEKRYQHRATAA